MPPNSRPLLGFIGIGLMGEAITRRLLDRGWQVTVWNREPERLDKVVRFGAQPAPSPAASPGCKAPTSSSPWPG